MKKIILLVLTMGILFSVTLTTSAQSAVSTNSEFIRIDDSDTFFSMLYANNSIYLSTYTIAVKYGVDVSVTAIVDKKSVITEIMLSANDKQITIDITDKNQYISNNNVDYINIDVLLEFLHS